MNRHAIHVTAALTLLVISVTSAASDPDNYVPDSIRSAPGGRSAFTIVAQAEIRSDIDVSNTTAAAGGGLLFALIDAGVNSSRAKKAEAAIQPLREALTGFDFDTLARQTTASCISDVLWFQAQAQGFGKDSSPNGLLATLDASATEQVMFFKYVYSLDPDGSQMIVEASLALYNKTVPAGKKPADRLKMKFIPFMQQFRSEVGLQNPAKSTDANVARWTASGGALARKSLTTALDDIRVLVARGLNSTAAQSNDLMKNRKKTEELNGGTLSTDGNNLTLTRALVE